MNPSSSGWIHKFINEFGKKELIEAYPTDSDFYEALKKTGFLYGFSVKPLLNKPISTLKLTKEELTKINLFHCLLYVHFLFRKDPSFELALEDISTFYKNIEKGKTNFLQKLRFTTSTAENVEAIMAARLHESNSLIKSEAASLFTYAMLFSDVLAFAFYLQRPRKLKKYLESLEKTLLQASIWALHSKKHKNKYDLLVMEMVTESHQFNTAEKASFDHHLIHWIKKGHILERLYVMEICCLAVWNDKQIDVSEKEFLEQLSSELALKEGEWETSMEQLQQFANENTKKITLFEYSHPVRHLYKQSSNTVKLLVLRNKNRLLKELNESGELLVLLSQSTQRELSPEEKHKMKEQLLDICKTVPSLTIFLLPGGSLLLPLLVKWIPALLPSAFNENRIED